MTNFAPQRAHRSQPRPTDPQRAPLTYRLDLEWERIRFDRRRRRHVESWNLPLAAAGACEVGPLLDLQVVVDLTGQAQGAAGNDLARELVDRAKTDDLAATLMLRRMLPLLLSRVRRYRGGTESPVDQLLVSACLALGQYDTVVRPNHVIPGLVSDALYIAFRRDIRRRNSKRFAEIATDDDALERAAGISGARAGEFEASVDVALLATRDGISDASAVELAEVVADAEREGVPAADLSLVRELGAGTTVGELAARHRVTGRTIRNRRRVAVDAIREAVGVRDAA